MEKETIDLLSPLFSVFFLHELWRSIVGWFHPIAYGGLSNNKNNNKHDKKHFSIYLLPCLTDFAIPTN